MRITFFMGQTIRKDILGDSSFWENKKVFVTGHTGFKGSWLSLWLSHKGARVTGYSLSPPTSPSLFKLAKVESQIEKSILGNIIDYDRLNSALQEAQPEIVIHMAAQPLVRESYKSPLETYQVNVMGTVNLFEAIRNTESVRAVVNVTTDKCYQNNEWEWGYRENEPLGGYDPYSSSKACSELVTAAYRNSFFPKDLYASHGVAIASARAGNVIGGGDWATDRLIPDVIRSMLKREKVTIRNPHSIRPWQHVLEPLGGYMLLAELLYEHGTQYGEAWNFGPEDQDVKPVQWIVENLAYKWGLSSELYDIDRNSKGDGSWINAGFFVLNPGIFKYIDNIGSA
ncbi:CDP-glucose 4,6-dehydratase [Cohnella hongkongensis]|uniref:CDP-glucose 4,6-dehydratase n=1 Tax=Cohnella hongkongensis TaxID=178337 RepID=A0ABV9FG07_9BACL